jgi:HD-GYP domain-containing protein (c-di-GMP phosphodiesterase class II)
MDRHGTKQEDRSQEPEVRRNTSPARSAAAKTSGAVFKLGPRLAARTICKPGVVGDLGAEADFPQADVFLKRLQPLSETEGLLCSLARMVEQRDRHTAGHCERLAVSGVALGLAMRLDSDSILSLYVGGYLHDVGKVGIPDSILFKPDKLNADEWQIMRAHPARGEEICRPLKSLRPVLPLIRHHHERWDGTGYPDGLRGDEIPLLARVVQVVDIYDALTNPRPYKQAYSSARALEILQDESDRGWRDKDITALFVRIRQRMLTKIADADTAADDPIAISRSLRTLQSRLAI